MSAKLRARPPQTEQLDFVHRQANPDLQDGAVPPYCPSVPQRRVTNAVRWEILMTQRLSADREGPEHLRTPSKFAITLQVNGVPHNLTVAPWTTLLDALRGHLDLTGT